MTPSASGAPTPSELLAAADDLLTEAHPGLAGRWPRAVATLCRQALEGALFDFWRAKAPGVEATSQRAQLLCLRSYIPRDLAVRADHAWAALSRACHVHAYELPPTAAELAGRLETVDELERTIRRRLGPTPRSRRSRRRSSGCSAG